MLSEPWTRCVLCPQVDSGRYDTRDDFTVVIQPFMKLFNAPRDRALWGTEVIDISYVTYDCFHFSQKGHAMGKLKQMVMIRIKAVQQSPVAQRPR